MLADATNRFPRLPRVSISRWRRRARQIQAELERCWGVRSFILGIVESSSATTGIIVAELLFQFDFRLELEGFQWIDSEALLRSGLPEEERALLVLFLSGTRMDGSFARLGWIHEALAWASHAASFPREDQIWQVQQWNASPHSFLLRLSSRNETSFWLKAVDPAQSTEYRITLALASIFPEYLPTIVSAHDEWGAWLMEDEGGSAADGDLRNTEAVRNMARCLAELQEASIAPLPRLLDCGCADWRLRRIANKIVSVLPLLEEAMAAQDVPGLPKFGRRRLEQICAATVEACHFLDAIGIPDTLLHNDLQLENVVLGAPGCRFIDWDQAGIGNPFLAFEQLRVQLPDGERPCFIASYRSWWSRSLRPEAIDAGLAWIPPIAIAVQLCSYTASLPAGTTLNSRGLRHLRSLTRQLEAALRAVHRSHWRSARKAVPLSDQGNIRSNASG